MLDSPAHFQGEDNIYNNSAYSDWVESNLIFPKETVKKGIEKAFVCVGFVVNADGSIRDILVADMSKDVDESFKREAIRLVKAMPRWVPAMYNGLPVNSYADVSFSFEYDPKTKKQKVYKKIDPKHLAKDPVYDASTIDVAPKFEGE